MDKTTEPTMQIISRSDARSLGMKNYFTGKPCGKGHVAKRLVSTNRCMECLRLHGKKWQSENDEAFREGKKRWRDKNLEQLSAYRLEWSKRNLEKDRTALKTWMASNPTAMAAIYARRRAAKIKAAVAWANREEIKKIYQKARELGMHVDHIIPLRGKLVCGLHVENNLQLLTAEENMRKRNRFYPYEFELGASTAPANIPVGYWSVIGTLSGLYESTADAICCP